MRQLTFLARAVSVEWRKKACWNGKSKWEVKIGKTNNSFKNCCEGKQRGEEVPEGKPKIDEILKIYKRDTRACLCTLYNLVKKEKLMVLEKAGIFQGVKSLKLRI